MDEESATSVHDLTKTVIGQAKQMKATAVEVVANVNSGFAVNVRKNNIETIEHSKTKGIEVTVYFDHRFGTAATTDLSSHAINIMLEKACYIARFTEEDPCSGLAEKELMAYSYPDLDLYHPWSLEIDETIKLAKACEAQGLVYDKRITNSEGAEISTTSSFNVYANSHEFYGVITSTRHSISCAFIAEHNKEMQRDYYYTVARSSKGLASDSEVALKAAKRTVDRLGAKKLSTRKCPVIFNAEIASSVIGNFVAAIEGTNLYRKTSFLIDHLQKPVFANHINIAEDPYILRGLGSSPFDAEGVKLSRNDLVKDGILQHYVLDSYSARKLKMKTTGNAGGIHNLIVQPGSLDFEGLLKKMNTGLLVTELMGGGVNIVTGDYSRGVFGYWVENGNIQYPVTGVTIASNLKDILLNIIEVGNDIDRRSNILVGSILFDEMVIAGS
jgi:PmbA protein